MNLLKSAMTGEKKSKDTTVRYEVHRMREAGAGGVERPPIVEEFYGLDRARLAALSYALDGPTASVERFTGVLQVVQVMSHSGVARRHDLIDVIDERVAVRLLNEVRMPHASELSVSIDQLQADVDALIP